MSVYHVLCKIHLLLIKITSMQVPISSNILDVCMVTMFRGNEIIPGDIFSAVEVEVYQLTLHSTLYTLHSVLILHIRWANPNPFVYIIVNICRLWIS